MKRLTREWVRKAEADFLAAKRLSQGSELLNDAVCFHCQQSAEKYLKALMHELNQTVPRTHNLVNLLSSLKPHHPSLRGLIRGLDFLTRFAIDTRYPGESASKRQTAAALRWVDRTRNECRSLLEIQPPRPKKTP